MPDTQEPLLIQYSKFLMTYPHIRTKIIFGLQCTTEVDYKSDGTGLEITKYDRAGLQNVIGFGLKSATKIVKNGLQSAMRLQTATDYKVIQNISYT